MIADNREDGGALIRQYWIERAALYHDNPKPGWLIPWDSLDEWNKETDRYIWDHLVAPYVEVINYLHKRIAQLERDNAHYREREFTTWKESNLCDSEEEERI